MCLIMGRWEGDETMRNLPGLLLLEKISVDQVAAWVSILSSLSTTSLYNRHMEQNLCHHYHYFYFILFLYRERVDEIETHFLSVASVKLSFAN